MALTVTVSQLNMYVKSVLTSDPNLKGVTVRGEISNYTRNARSGHAYFTLKDSSAAVKCVMFSSACSKVKFDVSDGLEVFVTGSVALYERDGAYQLYAEKMTPVGIGAAYLAFLQLKEKLEKTGLFAPEYKKPLPLFPRTIGLITSKTGAAVKDFLSISKARFPSAEIIVYPATVQGDGCRDSVIGGIGYFEHRGVDVICIARGGGSYEDLACFNDEALAYAIFQAKTPVVSAIGHEIDFTVPDFVADVRAATPSNAAELICPSSSELKNSVTSLKTRAANAAVSQIRAEQNRVETLCSRSSPLRLVGEKTILLDGLFSRVSSAAKHDVALLGQTLERLVGKVEAMNPLSVLKRGYAAVSIGEKTVSRASEISEGDKIKLRFTDGVIDCVAGKRDDL